MGRTNREKPSGAPGYYSDGARKWGAIRCHAAIILIYGTTFNFEAYQKFLT